MTDAVRRNLRNLLGAILFLAAAFPAAAWRYTEFSLDAEGRTAVIADLGDWNPYLEIRGTFHGKEAEFRYHSLSAGTYYRAAPWLKVGAFYRLQGGQRHVEDWQVFLVPTDGHSFDDVSGRYENLLYIDATPRFLVEGLPGRNWVAPVKVRWFSNFRNGHQSLMVRPGLTYVWMVDRRPVVNLSLNYAAYLALNFNDNPLYSHGPYVTALWHASDLVKVEGRAGLQFKDYSKQDLGDSWTLKSRHLNLGIGVILTPEFDL